MISLEQVKWWFIHRFHPRHRYNILRTGLQPGYYDPCVQIEVAVFESTTRWFRNSHIDWVASEAEDARDVFQAAVAFWAEHREELRYGRFENFDYEEELRAQSRNHLSEIMRHLGHMWYM